MNLSRAAHLCAGFILALAGGEAVAIDPIAAAFGAREGVQQLSLSPDGTKIAFLAPTTGQGSTLFTASTIDPNAPPKAALVVGGAPDRLANCRWVSNDRLICVVWGKVKVPETERPLTYSRLVAVDADGGNQKMMSTKSVNARRESTFGGNVIDWLPDEDGQVLMLRDHQRTDQTGTNVGSRREGFGVDRVDTRTLRAQPVEPPRPDVNEYITDGAGTIRIAGYPKRKGETWQASGVTDYRFRPAGSREWQALGEYDGVTREGFNPYAVDAEKNVAYGFRKLDGRLALVAKSLDVGGRETVIHARPDVDVDGLVYMGRKQRVVGFSYATDRRYTIYFDPALKALAASLTKALPNAPQISFLDATADEGKLLIFAGSDDNPGSYYLFDRATKRLQVLMQKRPQLAGQALAKVTPVSVRMRDGTIIPAYLTHPPGATGKGLPAIVLPHGGPASRDEWGFDWLPQYLAARGYAVLQPNYRGSEGYGDDFQLGNGFRSWRTAIGDVADAGRWLVSEGIADPARLGILGWSYGGYAALQSAVVEPGLFKAVVAIAPVTDLAMLREQQRDWMNYRITADYIGPIAQEASPARNAEKIKVPVLLVHGTLDSNVSYAESAFMHTRLREAGGRGELLTFTGLDHQLEDGAARAQMLERADTFLRTSMGM